MRRWRTECPPQRRSRRRHASGCLFGLRLGARGVAHDAIGPDLAGEDGAGREGDETGSVKDMLRAVSLKRDLHHACARQMRNALRAQEARSFFRFAHRNRAPEVAVRAGGHIQGSYSTAVPLLETALSAIPLAST